MSKYGYFMPVQNGSLNVSLALPQRFRKSSLFESLSIKHAEEASTVKLFLDAISNFSYDEAMTYMSKATASPSNLLALSDIFYDMQHYKHLVKAEFDKRPKNYKTNSILVMADDSGEESNDGFKKGSIVHLHMVKEPDSISKWKIYSIEREQ